MSDYFPQVVIVVLNWNGWKDTIECLDSIYNSTYPKFEVIICDNASTDNSISNILSWAKGEQQFLLPDSSPIKNQHIPKKTPENVIVCNPGEIQNTLKFKSKGLVLVPIKSNLGFAGGNNIGIKIARAIEGTDYVWLLNNDTVVAPATLSELVTRTQANRDIGICGSTVRYYDDPESIQTLGGCTFNKWIASSKFILPKNNNMNSEELKTSVEKKMNMVIGASMFVSMEFINEVGPLNEEYFLFAEEIDWSTRAGNDYSLGFSPSSLVYHKKGKSTGSTRNPMNRTIKTDYYNIRSRLIFTKKYYPWFLPTVYLSLIPMIFNRLRRRQIDRVSNILGIVRQSLFNSEEFYSTSKNGSTF